jgi:hypothetical protein
MRSRAVLLATFFVAFSVVHANAQQPSTRHGLTGGFIAGSGQNIPDRCVTVSLLHDCPSPPIVDMHAGWMFRPDLAVVGRLAILGGSYLPDTGVLGAAIRYWPAGRVWLSGSIGVGELAGEDDPGGVLSGPVGFEVVRLKHIAVGAQAEWFTARPGVIRWSNNVSLAFMLDWYSIR